MKVFAFSDEGNDLASVFWFLVVVLWLAFTLLNWAAGSREFADFPGGLGAVLAAVPASKALAYGLARMKGR